MLAAAEIPDAYQFHIDVSGSTVSYPNTGTAILKLTDAESGIAIAARTFGWTRTGNLIRLTEPDAVNTWASSVSGNIGGMTYTLNPFTVVAQPGLQTVALKSVYEGTATASATSTFVKCTTYPSPYLCMQ